MDKLIIKMDGVDFSFPACSKTICCASVEIFESDFVAIVGPNGGGKTTLVNLMIGLLSPNKGTVSLFGKKPELADRSLVGFVPQNAGNFDYNFPATVGEIVSSGLIPGKKLLGRTSSEDVKAVRGVLELLGMSKLRDMRIGDLSGGQKQKALIARALVKNPKLLILDEPTIGVDSDSQKNFFSLLGKLNKEGITIIIVSHDTSTVSNYVNKIICVNQGVAVHSATQDKDAMCGFAGVHKHITHEHKMHDSSVHKHR